jgi:hypothetical protein
MSVPGVSEEQMHAAAVHVADQARRLGATREELREILGAIGFYENPLRKPLRPAEWLVGTRSPGVLLQHAAGKPDGKADGPEMCRSSDPDDVHEMTEENTGHAANGRRFCKACNRRRRRAERAAAKSLREAS